MKPSETAKIDRATARWPVLLASLAHPPTFTMSGVATPLTSADPQREAVALATRAARTGGAAVRMTVTTPTGEVHRLIVTTGGAVVPLEGAATASAGTRRVKAARKPTGIYRLPGPARWAALGVGVLTAMSIVVLVTHGRGATAQATAPVTPPAPPVGQLYTEPAPPGWSQHAAWVLPILGAPATDPATGITAAVTPDDRSTSDTAAQRVGPRDEWLSILDPDGRTRYAFTLNGAPRFGPVITHIDGATVALVTTTAAVRYWRLAGGAETDVDLPTGAQLGASGESVLLTLPNDRLGYLHGGSVQTVEALPRTDPGIALDGSVLLTQPDTGAWWTLRTDASPTSVRPAAPATHLVVDRVLGITAARALIAWKPATTTMAGTDIVAAYDRRSGALLATTTAPAGTAAQAGDTVTDGRSTAAGAVVLGGTLAVIPEFTATAVQGAVFGTLAGQPATVTGGRPTALPAGTLIPVGSGGGHLMVVSQQQVYALDPA